MSAFPPPPPRPSEPPLEQKLSRQTKEWNWTRRSVSQLLNRHSTPRTSPHLWKPLRVQTTTDTQITTATPTSGFLWTHWPLPRDSVWTRISAFNQFENQQKSREEKSCCTSENILHQTLWTNWSETTTLLTVKQSLHVSTYFNGRYNVTSTTVQQDLLKNFANWPVV